MVTSSPPRRVYLDAAANAPLLPEAREALLAAIDDGWADPRRLHREGRRAGLLLDGARETVAALLGARTEEVSFTGGHAQAVHAAALGVLAARHRAGGGMVVSAVEHSAVLAAATRATEVHSIAVDRSGRVDVAAFVAAVRSGGVSLACLQAANGEVGTLQPVAEVIEDARSAGVPLLVDAAASAGHHAPSTAWDLLTADPRAWGGPGGIGVLAVRSGVRWRSPYPEHDGPERVPGSVDVPAALACAVALRVTDDARAEEGPRRAGLVDAIRATAAGVPDTEVLGDPEHRLPHVVTFSSLYVDGEAVVDELDRAGFAVGSGSACTASTLRPSHVLAAMGVLTHGNVRVGLPLRVAAADVTAFRDALPGAIARVRSLLTDPGADSPTTEPVAQPVTAPATEPVEVDTRGLRCPLPLVRLASATRDLAEGTVVRVLSTDPAAGPDLVAWCRARGHALLAQDPLPDPSPGAREPGLVSLVRLGTPQEGRG